MSGSFLHAKEDVTWVERSHPVIHSLVKWFEKVCVILDDFVVVCLVFFRLLVGRVIPCCK